MGRPGSMHWGARSICLPSGSVCSYGPKGLWGSRGTSSGEWLEETPEGTERRGEYSSTGAKQGF